MRAVFLQQRVTESAAAADEAPSFEIVAPPLGRWAGALPAVPWRFYELVWANLLGWRRRAPKPVGALPASSSGRVCCRSPHSSAASTPGVSTSIMGSPRSSCSPAARSTAGSLP